MAAAPPPQPPSLKRGELQDMLGALLDKPPALASDTARLSVLSADGATSLLKALTGRVVTNATAGAAFWSAGARVGYKLVYRTYPAAEGGTLAKGAKVSGRARTN